MITVAVVLPPAKVGLAALLARPRLQPLLPALVVDLLLPLVTQHVVSLAHCLEPLLGPGRLVLVWMKLQCQLPVGLLDLIVAGASGHPQHLVVVLAHGVSLKCR